MIISNVGEYLLPHMLHLRLQLIIALLIDVDLAALKVDRLDLTSALRDAHL